MRLKKALVFATILLILIPVCTLHIYVAASPVDLYYGFEDGFSSNIGQHNLVSYGNMAFSEMGAVGKSINLQDGYLELENSTEIRIKKEFSFGMWFNFNELTSGCPMFLSRTASSGDPFNGPIAVGMTDDFKGVKADITFRMKDGSTKSHAFYCQNVFIPQNLIHGWHHIAFVFDTDRFSLYIDGALVSTQTLPEYLKDYESVANNRQSLCIGRGFGTNMRAYVDEIYFYSRALTNEQALSLYSAAKPRQTVRLILQADSDTIQTDGQLVKMPVPAVYNEQAGELMVPAKATLSMLGAALQWDSTDRHGRADIILHDKITKVWVYDTNAFIGEKHYKMPYVPYTQNDVLMIPCSLLREMGVQISWNENSEQLTILY